MKKAINKSVKRVKEAILKKITPKTEEKKVEEIVETPKEEVTTPVTPAPVDHRGVIMGRS